MAVQVNQIEKHKALLWVPAQVSKGSLWEVTNRLLGSHIGCFTIFFEVYHKVFWFEKAAWSLATIAQEEQQVLTLRISYAALMTRILQQKAQSEWESHGSSAQKK